MTPRVTLALLVFATGLACQGPLTLTDVSPDPGAPSGGTASTAGLAFALASSPDALYAVALNAGVWKAALGAEGAPAVWTQLANSPRYAHCIAVDPSDPAHVVVGEREGDANPDAGERTGLWQSFDGGATFPAFHDPAANAPGQRHGRAVRAVALTPKGTILVATSNGLGRLKGRARAIDYAHSPNADVQTVTTCRDLVFARTASAVFVSRDDGVTWSSHDIPPRVGSFTVGGGSRGDAQALAGLMAPNGRVFAYVPFHPTEDNGNRNTLLVLDVKANTWQSQQLDTGNGTGLGGRRLIQSWHVDKPGLADQVGERIQLLFCAAQDISQATAIGADGVPQWRTIARTWAAGPGPDGKTDDVHSDIWAMHFDARGRALWLGTDGGVYGRDPFAGGPWRCHNAGLHTQHVHAIVAARSGGQDLLAFATQDNDAWRRDETGAWAQIGGLGDANWVAAVDGDPRFVLTARHCQSVRLSAFATGATPDARLGGLVLANDLTFGGTQCFGFEQPLRDEPASPSPGGATALLLARLPLQFRTASGLAPVPGRLGQPTANGGPALLRNRSFATNPDLNVNKGEGWEIVADDLPPGTRGFWATGGTKVPRYYLYGETGGTRRLYRRSGAKGTWQAMAVADVNPMAEYGPLFVNPYDADELFVSTASGVFASRDGGSKFALDKPLTALAFGNGRYPMPGAFAGGNHRDVVHATQANAMCPLACMAFLRDDPRTAVACSPFTGVFVRKAGGAWRDLSDLLPKPFTPTSSVAVTATTIYVATEGRGILAIRGW